jgi:heterodisulfide reductase subunit C
MDQTNKEQGYAMCEAIRAENRRRPLNVSAWWCWGCTTFTGGDPAKRCGETYACPQVLKRLERGKSDRPA